jgi:hypothetical protein
MHVMDRLHPFSASEEDVYFTSSLLFSSSSHFSRASVPSSIYDERVKDDAPRQDDHHLESLHIS